MKNWMMSLKILLLVMAILLAPGCGQEAGGPPPINGVQGPFFNVIDGQVLMTLKLLNMQVDAGLKFPIPRTQNSHFEFAPNALDGGMILQVYMDPEDLERASIGVGDGNTLPDGRPLPGIPGGRLENSLRIDTEWNNISFYYHKKLFGLWIPVGFETAGISGYWNLVVNQKRVGFIGLVGDDERENLSAGGIILLNLEVLRNRDLKTLIELSKKNPGVMY